MKLSLTLIFSVLFFSIVAQCDPLLIFTEVEKENFVKAYIQVKQDKPPKIDQQLYALARKYDISPAQFRQIQHPKESQRIWSNAELEFKQDVIQLKNKNIRELENTISNCCKANNISTGDYDKLLYQYRSCMKFQRSLSQYFKKWMN